MSFLANGGRFVNADELATFATSYVIEIEIWKVNDSSTKIAIRTVCVPHVVYDDSNDVNAIGIANVNETNVACDLEEFENVVDCDDDSIGFGSANKIEIEIEIGFEFEFVSASETACDFFVDCSAVFFLFGSFC